MIAELQDRISAYLPQDASFALAFSGGGDSLALLNCLKDHKGLQAVLHVDHGLRESSEAEAEQAAQLSGSLGHELVVLRWIADAPLSGLQAKARKARYGLLGQYCREHGIDHLITAHHADDQAETVLMRVKRGSGWRGAAGIWPRRYAPVWPELAGITLHRPALDLSRDELRRGLGPLTPIEDTSNQDLKFARVRMRHELAGNAALRADMLTLAADMAGGIQADTARIKSELRGHHLTHEGLLTVPRLLSAPALTVVAPIIGGQNGPADRRRIEDRLADLASGQTVSIGEGCMGQWDGEILTLSRDPVAMSGRKDRKLEPTAVPIVITPTPQLWDGRFLISGAAGQLHPERRDAHVGYRVHYGRRVQVRNLVQERLSAVLTGM